MNNKATKAVLTAALFVLAGVDAANAKPKLMPARLQPNLIELTFKARVSNRESIDLGAPGGSLGDMVLGNGDVLDLKNNVVGGYEYHGVVTRVTPPTEQRWVQFEYYFGDGTDSILMEGAEEYQTPSGLPALNRPQIYAVTGGTGRYFGASGQCSATRPDGLIFVINCQFSAIKPPRK